MKTLLLTLFFCIPLFLFGQNPEKHAQVILEIDRPDFIQYLNENGMEIDHAHKHGQNEIEITIPHSKLSILNDLEVDYEIEIEDCAAHYVEMVRNYDSADRDEKCGLINFDDGTMGLHHTYDEMQAHINSMESQFPNLVQISEIGTSVEGRTIFAVKISDNVAEDESDSEGVVYYDAITHAREPMGLETVLFYMWSLLENYNSDDELTYLVNNREMYFVPIVNPDGYVYNQTTNPNGGGFWRKNRSTNANGCFGVDLNRNFGHEWGNNQGASNDPCSNTYHGPTPFSEPETQAVRDFTEMIQPSSAFSCHTYSDVFLCPNGYNDDLDNYETYAEFASEFSPELYNGYGNWIQTIGYYGAGTTHDYLNSVGTIAYTPEIGHAFWENPMVICDRVQEMYPSMKFMSWVAGEYACFRDFELIDDEPIWAGSENALKIRIKNRGLSKTAKNVSVELNTDHPAVNFTNNLINYGDIPARQNAENLDDYFVFSVTDILSVGEEIAIQVIIRQDGVVSYEDVFYLYAGEKQVLFEDSAENGTDSWIFSDPDVWNMTGLDAFGGDFAFGDSPEKNYTSNTNQSIELNEKVDLSLAQQPWLEFNAKWSFEPNWDYVRLFATYNDGDFEVLFGNYTGFTDGGFGYTNTQHWVQERVSLTGFIGENDFSVRFLINTDFGNHSDGFYFDDFRIVDYVDPDMTNTNNPISENRFKIQPNPASNHLTVQFKNPPADFEMTLTDVQGKILKRAYNADYLSLENVVEGVYWLRVFGKEFSRTEKVIVVR